MANIFAEFAQPVRSIEDYQNDYYRQALVKGQLAGQTRVNALADLTAYQTRQTMADSQRSNAIIKAAYGAQPADAGPDAIIKTLQKSGDRGALEHAAKLQDQQGKQAETVAKTREAQAKAMSEISGSVKRMATGLMSNPTQESAIAMVSNIEALHKHFGIPVNFDSERQQIMAMTSPDQVRKYAAGEMGDANLMLAKLTAHNNGKVTTFTDTNPITNPAGPAPITMTTTPESDQTAATALAGQRRVAASAAAGRAQSDRHFGVQQGNENLRAGLNPDGSVRGMATDGSGKIDLSKVAPEDLAAAYRYKADGTLPPNMGRGAQGAAESRRLRAVASALDDQAGESPEDARIRQLALKGDVTAINQMRRREVAVGANVKNFDFNADQVLELSKKVDRSGVPIVNAWINAGRRGLTGNPELSAFDVAVKTTVNEFAQIVGGTTAGASTEGEKKKAEALLNAQQTPEQIIAVINQMRVESQNRMKSFADQRKQSMPTNRAGGAPAGGAPAGKPAGDIHSQADAILRGGK